MFKNIGIHRHVLKNGINGIISSGESDLEKGIGYTEKRVNNFKHQVLPSSLYVLPHGKQANK